MNPINFLPIIWTVIILALGYWAIVKRKTRDCTRAYLTGRSDAYQDAANQCGGFENVGAIQALMFKKANTEKQILADYDKNPSIKIFQSVIGGIGCPHLRMTQDDKAAWRCLECGEHFTEKLAKDIIKHNSL